MLVAGPNGQGVISTPASMCAQIVAPYPPPGTIGIASQSGNFVSSFMNYASLYGVGVSRADLGGQRGRGRRGRLPRVLRRRSRHQRRPGLRRGPRRRPRLRRADGQGLRAAAGRTGEGRGVRRRRPRRGEPHRQPRHRRPRSSTVRRRQAGLVRAATIEEAYDAAATFATQPLPKGPRVAVVSTAGGWGVVTADAIARARGLELLPMPADLKEALDKELPPRWSRNNPIDMAGGETRDTIPTVLEITASHPEVDAVVFLGMGIQGNQGRMEKARALLPRPRARADRRLPRAAGPAVHHRGGRAVAIARQAGAHRHRAGHRRPGQPRRRRLPRRRRALLRQRQPSGQRPVAPLAPRPLAPAAACSDPTPVEAVGAGTFARPMVPRSLYVLALAAVSGVAGVGVGLGRVRGRAARAGRRRRAPVTPVLSARRVPALLAAPIADRRLGCRTRRAAERGSPASPAWRSRAPDGRCTPSAPTCPSCRRRCRSSLTAVAALEVLGPDHRFRTTVVAAAAPVGGVVAGDAWLVGGGDPLLATADYAARLRASAPDGHADRDARRRAGRQLASPRSKAPCSATPPATTTTATPTPGRSASSTRTSRVRWRPSPSTTHGWRSRPTPTPPMPDERPADDPAAHAASVLADLSASRGIAVGGTGAGVAPAGAVELAAVESPPLTDVVGELLAESDNQTGELLLKELAVARGRPRDDRRRRGGHHGGAHRPRASRRWDRGGGRLGTRPRKPDELRAARRRSSTAAGPTRPSAKGCAVGGRDRHRSTERFLDRAVAGRLRAKTGTLNQSTALAGFVETHAGRHAHVLVAS